MVLPSVTHEPTRKFHVNRERNARKVYELETLMPSIRRDGILQPVGAVLDPQLDILTPAWGFRRILCALELGLETIPTCVFDGPDGINRLALVENAARKDLLPSEQAGAYRAYMDSEGITASQLAEMLGVSDAKVSKKLCMLKIASPLLVSLIDQNLLPETMAPELAKLDEAAQLALAETFQATGRVTREEVQACLGKKAKRAATPKQTVKLERLSLTFRGDELGPLIDELTVFLRVAKRAKEEGMTDLPAFAKSLKNQKTTA